MKGKKKNQLKDDDYDLLLQMDTDEFNASSSSTSTSTATSTNITSASGPVVASAEDEWPEEISKKPKKNKGKQPVKSVETNRDIEIKQTTDAEAETETEKEKMETNSESTFHLDSKERNEKRPQSQKEMETRLMKEKEKVKEKGLDQVKEIDKEKIHQEINENISAPKLLSKKEKEKLRKQRQKESEKSKASKLLDSIPDSIDENPEDTLKQINKPTSKKKGPSTTIALLQKMMAEQKAAEEAERLRLEEEKRLEEEEKRKREEEEKKMEEERQLKKEKEKARKDQLKKEGKLLTKAQKEKEIRNRQRLEQLLASGVQIAALTSHENEDVENKNKANFKENDKENHTLSDLPPTSPHSKPHSDHTRKKKKKSTIHLEKSHEEIQSHFPENKQEHSISPISTSEISEIPPSSKKNSSQVKPNASSKSNKKHPDQSHLVQNQTEPDPLPSSTKEIHNDITQDKSVKEELIDLKDSWEDESEEEKEVLKTSVFSETVKSTWDESSDDEYKESDQQASKKLVKKSLKKTKQGMENNQSSVEKSLEDKTTAGSSSTEKSKKSAPSPTLKQSKKQKDISKEKKELKHEEESLSKEDCTQLIPTSPTLSSLTASPSPSSPPPSTLRKEKKKATPVSTAQGDLRSPICCILGHVDTGKTKLLDKIRQTNVQDSEAGGITQQIGATYFPVDAIKNKIKVLDSELDIKVPGLLIIDTPGHESFTNLRSRGSSLCNMAILVVDIMHGLEPQTLESLNLLRQRKTPFIVALNKIDRMYDWKSIPNNSFVDSIKHQSRAVINEFEKRLSDIIVAFAEQGLNAQLYSENENMGKYVSIVPTSAITGEGIPDMLFLLIHLTQTRMSEKIKYVGELEATVLEVKVVEGLGTTIDVILSNGVLNESDTIVVCGLDGPIVTHIRALLTPQPMRELRVKAQYIHHKQIKAAMGVKISANGLDKAVAGSRLLVLKDVDDEDQLKEEIMEDLKHLLASVDKSGKGVWVQASTLGSLEALLSFLKSSEIPVAGMHIGPVHKKDVMKASIMLERAKEFAVMLCFDVKIDKDAQELADEMGVRVFKADIIYHLFDQFTAYYQELVELRRKDAMPEAVFPCILKMVPDCLFNKRDPIIMGVDVIEGVLRLGTPICVLTEEKKVVSLGKVTSIEHNRKSIDIVKRGHASVAIKIECPTYEHPKMYGRHFDEKSDFYSMITRQSIDVLKANFKDEMDRENWLLLLKLKSLFGII
ncbi:hypothetical protein HMI54_001893 [Coelomomyces lativittatus]|nr:hypothetical protein HMI56_007248 [Coelomomyces lativittatus]KAJ1510060.1 hypothetical protein HMI54_001893 [Coelomomyces lativittatus]KAJ1516918.1 hypothetical protein HMI55_001076 [Coelomomyces lativittatus]